MKPSHKPEKSLPTVNLSRKRRLTTPVAGPPQLLAQYDTLPSIGILKAENNVEQPAIAAAFDETKTERPSVQIRTPARYQDLERRLLRPRESPKRRKRRNPDDDVDHGKPPSRRVNLVAHPRPDLEDVRKARKEARRKAMIAVGQETLAANETVEG